MGEVASAACPFCRIARGGFPAAVVYEDTDTLAFLDLYPATRGHTLVIPKSHVEDIYSMPAETGARIMATAIAVSKALRQRLSPAGLSLIQANGAASGQTVYHFHLHLVPRYEGDAVTLKFGHGTVPESMGELRRLAALLAAALRGETPQPRGQ